MSHRLDLFVLFYVMLCAPLAHAAEPISIVAMGNSITRHGPAPALRWQGDWGMAASSVSTDYVGQVGERVRQHSGVRPTLSRISVATLEREPEGNNVPRAVLETAQFGQLVIVALGDNVQPPSLQAFGRAYGSLVRGSRPKHGVLFCLSTWWGSVATDEVMQAGCAAAGGVFVPIGDLRRRGDTHGIPFAGISDPGVLAHPNDNAMAAIAERIFAAWIKTR
jgi:hypothetical protein